MDNTPLDKIRQKRQDKAVNDAENAKTQSIIEAIKSSGGETKDSVTSAMHDLLLATLVAKDPRLVEVSSNLGKLLESIAKAGDDLKNSGLAVIPKTFAALVGALKDLPTEIAQTDKSPELIPYLEELNKSIKVSKTVVTPNVQAKVDLSPLTNFLERIENAVKDNRVEIPETNFSDLESAIRGVEDTIKNIEFPIPNYVLPFKDINGKATQVQLDASGNIPTSGGSGDVQYTEGDTDTTITGTAMLVEGGSNTLRVPRSDISSSSSPTVGVLNALPLAFNGTTYDQIQAVRNAANTTGAGVLAAGLLAQFDDTSPTSITENSFGNVRISANRNLYSTIRDAAGNERGLNVDANGNISTVIETPNGDSAMDDTNDAVRVNIVAGSGSGGTSATDDSAFTAASGAGTPMMGFVTSDSVDSGDVGVIGMLANRQLKTTLYDSSGVEVTSFGGGTQYTEDVAAAANPVGTALNLIRDDARGGSLTTTDGDNVAARGTNAGELYVKHVDSITADTELPAAVALADGMANPTAPAVGAFNMAWDGGDWARVLALSADSDDKSPADPGVLSNSRLYGYDGTNWDRLRGDSTNGLDVDITRMPATFAEDAAHNTGDLGVQVLTKRTDTAASSAGTDGDYATLNTDNTGRLWVRVGATDSITPGTSATHLGKAEDAAHASGDTGVMALGVRVDTPNTALSGTDGDYTPVATTSTGAVRPAPMSEDFAALANGPQVKKYYTNAGAVTDGIIWSPAAGKRWYVTDIFINVSAAATVTLEDDKAGGDEAVWKAELAANSGWSHSFNTPLFSGEDAADLLVTTTAGNVYITVTGYEI